jgi:hypothetical protein
MKGSVANRINEVVDSLLNRKPTIDAESIINVVMENPDIVWAVARIGIAKRVRHRMSPKTDGDPYSMYLEGYGVHNLSQLVTIKVGRTKLEIEARLLTPADLRDYIRSLEISAENAPKIAKARKLLEEMTPYYRQDRKLNLERFCELKLAGVPPPKVGLTATERSERIREQWARLTPEQRKAIHEKRLQTRAAKKAETEK